MQRFVQETQCETPRVSDPHLRLEIVYQGNDTLISYKVNKSKEVNLLSPVTKMAFLGNNDILILNKNDGKVIRILNQTCV